MKKKVKYYGKIVLAVLCGLASMFSIYLFLGFFNFMNNQYEQLNKLSEMFRTSGFNEGQINGMIGNISNWSPKLGEYKIQIYVGLIISTVIFLVLCGIIIMSIIKTKEKDYEKQR